jgi:nucleoside-diphosphate-sugar epimerase
LFPNREDSTSLIDNNKIVLVAGATGAVGPCVIHALDQAGFRIRSFSVDTPTSGMFPQNVEVLIGDVTDPVAVQSAMQGVDAVVHMAALLHIINPPPELREKYKHVNVNGTATVIEASIKAGVKRIVLFSTIAVYGPSNGSVLNEMSPTHPDTFYAQTKHAAEQIVLAARGVDGQPLGTVLRLGAVYGARIKGNYEQLIRALAVGIRGTRSQSFDRLKMSAKLGYVRHFPFIPVGNGLNRRTLVYDKDVGRAASLAISHPSAAGRVFNVTDGGFHTLSEIIESICSALGRKRPWLSLPVGPMRLVAGLIEKLANAIGIKAPVNREMIDKYIEDIAVDGSLIQIELGFVPHHDLKTGWEETIREMRETGAL